MIMIRDDLATYQWYDLRRFANIKELRKRKLFKLKFQTNE